MSFSVTGAFQGVRWFLREFTGETRWDAYVLECREHGHEPISRREFEHRRADLAERSVTMRCC